MAGYQNFQVDRNKRYKNANVFQRGNNRNRKSKSEKMLEGVALWASFYRANPHRFVKDYLNINLKMFQMILLYAMMHYHTFVFIAARGMGKTWLTAIFCVVRAILYPETKIIIASGIKSQGREVIDKIVELKGNSPNLDREIEDIKTNANNMRVDFHNGSWIRVVASNDNARGGRANLLIVDEFRIVDLNIIQTVLRKFKAASRQPKYLSKPEYQHLQERNKEIYLSSAWLKSHYSYELFSSHAISMAKGKPFFSCALPYQVSIKEGLLMREQVEDEMSEKTFDPVKWSIEMESLFYGISDKAFFTYEELMKNRKVGRVFYPLEVTEMINDKSIQFPKKEIGEIRIVSADIATREGANNDASAYALARLIPSKDGYEIQMTYMESLQGGHTSIQALKIRQLYEDFDADYIVIDIQNAGIGIYDRLTENIVDTQRGTEYTPLTCMNDESLAKRCVFPNAPKVIFAVSGNSALNSEIATKMRDVLRRGKLRLPISENEASDYVRSVKNYEKLPADMKNSLILPYVETSLMINEILNLESEITDSGVIKLKEQRTARKDRYSSISYLVYFALFLEVKNRKKKQDFNLGSMFMVKKGRLK